MKRFLYELSESWKIAASQMRSNLTRSTLTALGVIIGIVAVTLMGTAIGGIQVGFDKSMSIFGDDVLYVGQWPWRKVDDWWNYRDRKKMKTEYADALNRMIAMTPNSNLMIAIPTSSVIRNVKYADSEVGNVLVRGTVSDYIITSTFDFKEGRFFNDLESRSGANVCVVGYDVADALFPSASPIDKSVLINGQPFKIVGVIARQGSFLGLFSLDSIVVMPLPAFQKYFTAKSEADILVKVKDKTKLAEAKDELDGLMRRVRGLPPEKNDDFSINEQQALKSTLDPIKNSIAIAGLFITGLSLFVGAIGIMNITFVRSFTLTKVIFMMPMAPTKSERPVMKSPAMAMEFLIGSSVLFNACCSLILKSSFFSGGKPRTRRIKPSSSSLASANFVLSFTFTRMSASLLAVKYF